MDTGGGDKKKKEYKYFCEKCNYKCNAQSQWKIHIGSNKHQNENNGKKIELENKESYDCEKCAYKSKNKYNYLQHKLNYHATREERENEFKFYCKVCDYGTFSKDFFESHKTNEKHKKMMEYNK